MELELEKRARDEGRNEGRIEGTIITGRLSGWDDDRIADTLAKAYGLSHEEALKEIWDYDHPEAQGQEPAFNI